jgi:two-component system sensor histidine kinase KdpD
LRKQKGITGGISVHEKILVCVNHPSTAVRLIAMGSKIAKRVTGQLLVLYIQVDNALEERDVECELSSETKLTDLASCFEEHAKKFDGKFIIVNVSDRSKVAKGITSIIKEKKITQVVIGETGIPRWKEIIKGSIITKILSEVRNVDILIAGNREKLGAKYLYKSDNNKKSLKNINGKLKIYLGAAAGVGKTVAMLRNALELKQKGIDVIIGAVETHNRKETAEYIGNLEIIPFSNIEYKGKNFLELNIEGIIARKPKVVIIDELAHSNVPGSKNNKRFEDIKEILASGIDVITAMNVQHLESLNDFIEDLTKVKVRETVPDDFVSKAEELVLIDITPGTLRERLREGKIYSPEKVEQALSSFFKKENLQALREISLREVAQDIENTKKRVLEKDKNFIKENVLVCIKGKSDDDRLIRKGFRLSSRFKAGFFVLNVKDISQKVTLEESQQRDILYNLSKRLEADFNVLEVKSKRFVQGEIINYIDSKNITKLIIGQSVKTRWDEIFCGSIINSVLVKTKGIDIFIIAQQY